ncbi:metal-dependent hydrolase [Acetilactobacillus jinshanensis]|uniref:metal-dependent hydrolase n=1 Tax=Acetilactobacillus jinshanensis TaxID=1720083 RepID=UPI0013A63CDD|nr:metal-dependent hydrolase [Acetilactobacillus jinshanensis]URL61388.1 metal-dependent hydrolase [uncultured bacterium]
MALRATHIFLSEALVSGCLYITKQPMPVDIVSVLGTWFGVQLPDIDTGETPINRKLGFIGKMIGKMFKHRTWTHSIWAVIIMFGLAMFLPVPASFNAAPMNYLRLLYIMIAVGYLLHLFEDMFSVQGICWFYPFQKFQRSRMGHLYKRRKHWNPLLYRTGGYEELFIRYVSFVIMIYFFLKIFIENYLK